MCKSSPDLFDRLSKMKVMAKTKSKPQVQRSLLLGVERKTAAGKGGVYFNYYNIFIIYIYFLHLLVHCIFIRNLHLQKSN